MFTISIPTALIANAPGDEPGRVLATMLRQVADKVEEDIRVVPTEDDDDWIPETYRHASRIDGVLVGAVYTLEGRTHGNSRS